MNYCSLCGSKVSKCIPAGDDRDRDVCDDCGHIHYENPKVVTGCLVEQDGKILLCQRAIEPRYGLWTLPAGFMENGETVEQGAARETWEEAMADVEVNGLYTMFSLTHINQIYMLFRGRFKSPEFSLGPESLDVKLVSEDEIPWDEMAFPVIEETLRLYLEDRKTGNFGPHLGEMRAVVDADGTHIETRMNSTTDQA
ncbi:ADP-ribose pyrophosphatase [Solemya velum gill symbiont]|uniref:ADP-ribose pyrophosphatase n=1 Tax=Solemya velum gill symbiont TaxID=2340 RepID=A0A0B0H6D6_SOVGS|nr:NUDIX domain-containing protein [Solemya velum gill symbiont]KHF25763.1 ADP-ribose pyrophosphatase [Solemya velum gill symbiont]